MRLFRIVGKKARFHLFVDRSGFADASVIWLDWQATVPPIDEYGKFDFSGSPQGVHLGKRRSNTAPGEDNVVYQDNRGVFRILGQYGGLNVLGQRIDSDIVSMEGDIDGRGVSFEVVGFR